MKRCVSVGGRIGVFFVLLVGSFCQKPANILGGFESNEAVDFCVYEDRIGQAVSEVILKSEQFHDPPDSLRIGYSDASWWIRLRFKNATSIEQVRVLVLENPRLDSVDFYAFDENGVQTEAIFTGDQFPVSTRPFSHRYFAFELALPPMSSETIFLRVQSKSSISLPVRLYTEQVWQQFWRYDHIFFSAFLGLMLGIGLYNLLVGLVIKDRLFIYFVGVVFFSVFTFITLSGWGFANLWPESPWWTNQGLLLGILGVQYFWLLFLGSALKLRQEKSLFFVQKVFESAVLMLLVSSPVLPYSLEHQMAIYIFILGSIFTLFAMSFKCFKKDKTAVRILLAWCTSISICIVHSFQMIGFEGIDTNLDQALILSAGLGALLLSFVLGSKIQEFHQNQLDARNALAETNRELEQRVADRTDALSNANELLQNIINNLPHSVFWKDRGSVYLGGNRNFAQDAGLSQVSDLVGKTDFDLAWTKDEAIFFRQCDQQVMDEREPIINLEEPQQQGDGKQATLLTSKVPLTNPQGEVVGLLGMYVDITERKELEEKLLKRTEELEEKNRKIISSQQQLIHQEKSASLGRLLSGIAHEFRNPLNFIINLTESSIEQLEENRNLFSDGEKADVIEDIQSSHLVVHKHSLRLKQLTSSLMALAEGQETPRDPELVDINELIANYLSVVAMSKRLEGLKVQQTFDHGIPEQYLVMNHLGRICVHLFNNAFESLKERQRLEGTSFKPGIAVQTRRAENKIQMVVADNGVGIPIGIQDKIFEPLFTTKPSTLGHIGMGLAICYSLLKGMDGGDISFESVYGQTHFVITIPESSKN